MPGAEARVGAKFGLTAMSSGPTPITRQAQSDVLDRDRRERCQRARAVVVCANGPEALPYVFRSRRQEGSHATTGRDSSADLDQHERLRHSGAALYQLAHRSSARRQHPHQTERFILIGGRRPCRPPGIGVRRPPVKPDATGICSRRMARPGHFDPSPQYDRNR